MRITLLVFGTRGEVQPLTALARGLERAGHTPRIVTQAEFHDFVTGYGIACAPINVNLRDAERTRKRGGQYSLAAIRALARRAQAMLTEIWTACAESEALILCDMGLIPGWPIKEKLGVPTFVAAFYPEDVCLARQRATVSGKVAGWLRRHVVTTLSEGVILRPQLNHWRKTCLGLPPTRAVGGIEQAWAEGVPTLHAFSEHIFPKPAHWPECFSVTGYWFLERAPEWQPDAALQTFLAAGDPPVYVGFGSVAAHDMARVTQVVLAALEQTGQRGLLTAGWNNLGQQAALPPHVLTITGAPHDWLFPQVAAAVHHGGAGTTGIALRSGIPNIIVPFVFDNPFWASRVAELGVGPAGIPPRDLTVARLSAAIDQALHDAPLRARCQALAQRLQAEDGVAQAVALIQQRIAH